MTGNDQIVEEIAALSGRIAGERHAARQNASLRATAKAIMGDIKRPGRWLSLPARSLTLLHRVRHERDWRLFLDNVETDALNDPLKAAAFPTHRAEAQSLYSMAAGQVPFEERSWSQDALSLGAERLSELVHFNEDGLGTVPDRVAPRAPGGREGIYLVNAAQPETRNGYTVRTHAIARTLVDAGLDLTVMAISRLPIEDRHKDYKLDGVAYHLVRASDAPTGSRHEVEFLADAVEAHARETGVGVIHAASNWRLGWAGLLAARRLGIPFFYEARGFWEVTRLSVRPDYAHAPAYFAQHRLEGELAAQADETFTLNAAMASELERRGMAKGKAKLIPNGIGLEPDGTPPDEAQALAGRSSHVVAMVGTLTPYEGIDRLIEAIAAINAERTTKVGLLIAGGGPAEDTVRGQVRAQGNPDWAVITGTLTPGDMAACYRLVDIAAFPRQDLPITRLVQPLKPIEAMAKGVAVVTSDLPSVREINEGTERCRLVMPSDTPALQKALVSLIDDDEARSTLAKAGAEWAQKTRRWQQTLSPLIAAYQSALSEW